MSSSAARDRSSEPRALNIGGAATGPLAGVHVLDLSTVVMGPMAAQLLGDLGADVIRVETPFDSARIMPLGTGRTAGMAPQYLNVNRNKRSVALNLKDRDELATFFELVAGADVFMTNMRSTALSRLGLGYDEICDRFPNLIYAHAQGFDPSSTYSHRPAYDEVVQAVSGLLNLQERASGTLQYIPTFIGDKVASLYLAIGIISALYHRQVTGSGQRVELPMADALLAWTAVEHLAGETNVPATGPVGYSPSLAAEHAAIRTKDGAIGVAAYTNQDMRRLLIGAGLDDLAAQPEWDNDDVDFKVFWSGMREVSAHSARKTTAEWEAYLQANDMPYGVVVDIAKLADDPYVQEMGVIFQAEHPSEGTIKMVANPLRFSRTPVDIRRHAELPGQSTEEVRSWLHPVVIPDTAARN